MILDQALKVVGKPWRGNLRETINAARSAREWVDALWALCGADRPDDGCRFVLAIDTPLGFSDAFVSLVTRRVQAGEISGSESNPYLYRQTERYLCAHGKRPLSAIKDMIGSQATKGMHVLTKFAPRIERCGVWAGEGGLTVIETYPAACVRSATLAKRRGMFGVMGNPDKDDALICALVASFFDQQPDILLPPPEGVPDSEGWIWVPRGAVAEEPERISPLCVGGTIT